MMDLEQLKKLKEWLMSLENKEPIEKEKDITVQLEVPHFLKKSKEHLAKTTHE